MSFGSRSAFGVGERFGRYVVTGTADPRRGLTYVAVRCDCGTERVCRLAGLRSGDSRSCGCLRRERVKAGKHGLARVVNGLRTPEYEAWAHMLRRCHTPTTKNYADYGGRGISVCDRWRNSFTSFLEDMGSRPSAGHSLERKDNNGNYEPGNCVWATRLEQNNNTRFNHPLTFRGKTQTMAQWSRELGFPRGVISGRIARGWSTERALSTPLDLKMSRSAKV